MDKELYDRIDMASKFAPEPTTPHVDQAPQVDIGLTWADRQQHRPEPEPIITMKPVVPLPN